MADGRVGVALEREVPQVAVGIKAAEIRGEKVHERTVSSFVVARPFEIDSVEDGVRVGIVGVFAGKHLLHLILGPRASLDEGSSPRFSRLVSPGVLPGIPHTDLFQCKWSETEGVDAGVPGRAENGKMCR